MSKIFKAHRPKPRDGGAQAPKTGPVKNDDGTAATAAKGVGARPKEIGGPSGPEPTRYGDWERKGICVDF